MWEGVVLVYRWCRFCNLSKVLISDTFIYSIQNTQYVGGGFNDVSAIRANQKIKILATLLPDEILSDPVSRKYRMYNTAVIFPDVSGTKTLNI